MRPAPSSASTTPVTSRVAPGPSKSASTAGPEQRTSGCRGRGGRRAIESRGCDGDIISVVRAPRVIDAMPTEEPRARAATPRRRWRRSPVVAASGCRPGSRRHRRRRAARAIPSTSPATTSPRGRASRTAAAPRRPTARSRTRAPPPRRAPGRAAGAPSTTSTRPPPCSRCWPLGATPLAGRRARLGARCRCSRSAGSRSRCSRSRPTAAAPAPARVALATAALALWPPVLHCLEKGQWSIAPRRPARRRASARSRPTARGAPACCSASPPPSS